MRNPDFMKMMTQEWEAIADRSKFLLGIQSLDMQTFFPCFIWHLEKNFFLFELASWVVAQMVKKKYMPAMEEARVGSLEGGDPQEKGMATHSSTLAMRSHGQKSQVDYSLWGGEESDIAERLTTSIFSLLGG